MWSSFKSIVQVLYAVRSHFRVSSLVIHVARSHLSVLSKFSVRSVLIFDYSPSLFTPSFLMYEYYGSCVPTWSVFIYEHYCLISLCDPSHVGLLLYLFLYAVRSHTRVFSVSLCSPFPYTSVLCSSMRSVPIHECYLFLYAVRSHVRVCYPCVFLLPCIVAESVQTYEY